MTNFNQILSNLRESENNRLSSLVNEIRQVVEVYDENMANDEDDVFAGTQDSYAYEMIEQHLFDAIYYNDLFSGCSDETIDDIYNEIFDTIMNDTADVSEEWLKRILDKYKIKY